MGHIQDGGTGTARGTVRGPRSGPSGVFADQHAQRRGGDHPVRDGAGQRLRESGVPAARVVGRGRGGTAAVDQVPGVRLGHGELRTAALSGRAEEGGRAVVGPGTVRAQFAGHAARRQVSIARRVLVRRRRRARGRVHGEWAGSPNSLRRPGGF